MSSSDFAPIERSSVAEQVAKKLLDLVRTKNLKPGDQLPPERELATLMQVSRPSVREALRGLQILGVLKVRQGGGIYVTSLEASDLLGPLQLLITLNEENVNALYESRRLIDGAIGRMAAERISDADIDRLKNLLIVQRDLLADPIGFRVSDVEFHRTISEATGNPFLVRVSTSLYVLGMEYRRIAAETPGVLSQSFADHEIIVSALAARDPDAAQEGMIRHMANVHQSTVAAMEMKP
ncbi:FadR/GntR family transcriptional regulator [Kaistia dalseonensis]|uniref:DNA-binding FadR family transcriptional regulator n=1 Tax=Kaistia dalseonensis TaxID=410840 RepID=A0ABU0H9F4_9HYPH|nr:FadR/GntR family transcriptional regulator [Kaistia dalseonensis]MCX5496023.1 FadR/GntR family transcriptional regulator [Kaistia dalseonensis]MDQ0438627.1 DNA-binding FadR family transcriptional regulator [Kaistia dalseonensis]